MAGYVSPATQAAASAVATSLLNSYKTALDTIVNPARAQMYQTTTGTTIANSSSTWTAIGFDTELADTVGGHSTVTNTARYVCQAGWGGLYLVNGIIQIAGNATGARWVGIAVNGTAPQTGSIVGFNTVPNAGQIGMDTCAEVLLAAGDFVQVVAQQTSGGGLGTSIVGSFTSSMSVRWVAVA